MVARYAANHPQKLQAMLKTAPSLTRPALLKAIAQSQARYQQALEAGTGTLSEVALKQIESAIERVEANKDKY